MLGLGSTVSAVLVAASVFIPAVTQAAEPARIVLPSVVSAVTVYNDQAAVTRSGSVQVPVGDSILTLGGVPAGIIGDTPLFQGAVGRVVCSELLEGERSMTISLAAG